MDGLVGSVLDHDSALQGYAGIEQPALQMSHRVTGLNRNLSS